MSLILAHVLHRLEELEERTDLPGDLPLAVRLLNDILRIATTLRDRFTEAQS